MAKNVKIEILGDARDAKSAFGDVDTAADGLGTKLAGMGKFAAIGAAGVAVAVAGIGTALYSIGSSFDDAFDTLRIRTGSSGEELAGLKSDVEAIGTEIPASFGKAAEALSSVFQKLGAQDNTKTLTEQFLELSRITDSDLVTNIDAGTSALNAFGIGASDQGGALDQLFRTYQNTGVAVGDLASQLADTAPSLKALGFDFDQSAALAGTLGKQGLSLADVMPALSKSMAAAAKAGVPAGKAFDDIVASIANAPDDTAAAAAAFDALGPKAGPKFAALIRQGGLSYDSLLSVIDGGSDSIMQASKDTQDFSEKWEMFKNKVLLKLEPIASKVFDFMSKGMDKLAAFADRLTAAFDRGGWSAVWGEIADTVSEAWPTIKQALGDLWEGIKTWVAATAPKVAAQLQEWTAAFVAWATEAIPPLLEKLGVLLGKVGDWVLNEGLPMLGSKVQEWGSAFLEWIGPLIGPMLVKLQELLAQLLAWILTEGVPKLAEKLGEWQTAFLGWIGEAATHLPERLGALLGVITDWITTSGASAIGDAASSLWDGIKTAFVAVINWIIDKWNSIEFSLPSVTLPDALGGGTIGGQTFGTPDISNIGDGVNRSDRSGGGGVKAHAIGGILSAGWNKVGELGEELVNGSTGHVIPMHRNAGSAGPNNSRTLNVHPGAIVIQSAEPGRSADELVNGLRRIAMLGAA